jgi:GMP synthase-like glutamine amidotransferase
MSRRTARVVALFCEDEATMRIGVLEAGKIPVDFGERYDGFPKMFETLLGAVDPTLAFKTYPVVDGVFPASVSAEDGWLVTGSRHGVYDDLPWIAPLKEFLRRAVDAGIPVIGICFGHQILAEALGGKVVKVQQGWGCGVQRYALSKRLPFLDGLPEHFALNAMHQDQVVVLPPGAEVIATSEFCPYASLAYGGNALSFQGHPEFSRDFVRELLLTRRGAAIPVETADVALSELDRSTDHEAVARSIVGFLRSASAARPG